jgi:hypothetical protein
VTVNRSGGWDSIHSEIQGLAPLVLWKHGLRAVSDMADADYAAEIRVYEREYLTQWRTSRSLALEVLVWAVPHDGDEALPLAAGRVISAGGDQSFSSSHTINRLLSLAIKKLVNSLEPLPDPNQAADEQERTGE